MNGKPDRFLDRRGCGERTGALYLRGRGGKPDSDRFLYCRGCGGKPDSDRFLYRRDELATPVIARDHP